jgi:hypothetical protein
MGSVKIDVVCVRETPSGFEIILPETQFVVSFPFERKKTGGKRLYQLFQAIFYSVHAVCQRS